MSDRERSRSLSTERKIVSLKNDSPSPHGRRDRDNHDSPSHNIKIVKRSYSRSPSAGRSRNMSYRGDRGREERERGDKERDRDRERRYRSRSRSRSAKRYKSRGSHSRSRSHSRRRHIGTRDNPEPGRCLGVFGLSVHTTETEIHYMFSKYGPLERVQVVIDAKTGQSRGFCFVYYVSTEDAKVAKEKCNGIKLGGKSIRVDFSITERAHTPTPGIYMGKPTYMSSRMGWSDRRRGGRDRDDYYGGSYNRHSYRDRRSQSPSHRRRRYVRSRSHSYSPRRY